MYSLVELNTTVSALSFFVDLPRAPDPTLSQSNTTSDVPPNHLTQQHSKDRTSSIARGDDVCWKFVIGPLSWFTTEYSIFANHVPQTEIRIKRRPDTRLIISVPFRLYQTTTTTSAALSPGSDHRLVRPLGTHALSHPVSASGMPRTYKEESGQIPVCQVSETGQPQHGLDEGRTRRCETLHDSNIEVEARIRVFVGEIRKPNCSRSQ